MPFAACGFHPCFVLISPSVSVIVFGAFRQERTACFVKSHFVQLGVCARDKYTINSLSFYRRSHSQYLGSILLLLIAFQFRSKNLLLCFFCRGRGRECGVDRTLESESPAKLEPHQRGESTSPLHVRTRLFTTI